MTSTRERLSFLLVVVVVVSGVGAGTWVAIESADSPASAPAPVLVLLVLCALASDCLRFQVHRNVWVAFEAPFLISLAVLGPGWLAVLAAAATLLNAVPSLVRRTTQFKKALFNCSVDLLVAGVGYLVYAALSRDELFGAPSPGVNFVAVVIAAATASALVLVLVEVVVWLHHGRPVHAGNSTVAVEIFLAPVVVAAAAMSVFALVGFWAAMLVLQRAVARAFDREHAALHDHLTGLANRAYLEQHVAGRPHRAPPTKAVLLLDLDRFKEVNDTLGHHAGDELLRHVADRIRLLVREDDLAVRLGGDEFAVLVELPPGSNHADALAQRLIDDLGAPYELGAGPASIGVSIGIAYEREPETNVASLLEQADRALYRAKATRGCWAA